MFIEKVLWACIVLHASFISQMTTGPSYLLYPDLSILSLHIYSLYTLYVCEPHWLLDHPFLFPSVFYLFRECLAYSLIHHKICLLPKVLHVMERAPLVVFPASNSNSILAGLN